MDTSQTSSSSAAARRARPSRRCSRSRALRVELFERERFPRFHIGESLIPETYWVLKRLNMLPKMQQSHFVKKYSVQFVNASGKLSAPFYFWDNKPHECSQTWQVVRSEFDQMMLDNAREHGVDVHEGVRVSTCCSRATARSASRSRTTDGTLREVRAKVVVDASGQSGLLQNRLQAARLGSDAEQGRDLDLLGRRLPRHRPRRGRDAWSSRRANKNGWFWYIPQHDNIVSVGVVAPFDYLFKRPRRATSRPTTKKSSAARRSSSASPTAHARHRLLRDEGLLVPLDAGGRRRLGAGRRRVRLPRSAVFLGRAAGAEVGRAGRRRDRRRARQNDTSAAQLGKWGPVFNEGVDRMRRLVCEYYDGFSFGHSSASTRSCAAR